ncbi:MAG: hypothetical protein FWD15_03905 [Alphaproteobacteria bacterium]|nr:hypothetical protein [Alphaproteobacteria bacterium]
MYEGLVVRTFAGENIHGSVGLTLFGNVPEEDRKTIAKNARIKLGLVDSHPLPATAFVMPMGGG